MFPGVQYFGGFPFATTDEDTASVGTEFRVEDQSEPAFRMIEGDGSDRSAVPDLGEPL